MRKLKERGDGWVPLVDQIIAIHQKNIIEYDQLMSVHKVYTLYKTKLELQLREVDVRLAELRDETPRLQNIS